MKGGGRGCGDTVIGDMSRSCMLCASTSARAQRYNLDAWARVTRGTWSGGATSH